jgi:hypothetical protein
MVVDVRKCVVPRAAHTVNDERLPFIEIDVDVTGVTPPPSGCVNETGRFLG